MSQILHHQNNQRGFSLIECVIAVGVLAVLMGGMMSIQTSILSVVQTSINKNKADLVLNSAMAQVQYVLDAYGQKQFPTTTSTPKPLPSPKFSASVINTEVKSLKLSEFLVSAIKIFYVGVGDETSGPPAGFLELIPTIVDPLFPSQRNNFIHIKTNVKWTQGNEQNISNVIFMINTQAIKIGTTAAQSGGTQK